MALAVICDGCGNVIQKSNWQRLDMPNTSGGEEAPVWVIDHPATDKLGRYIHRVHLHDVNCVRSWVEHHERVGCESSEAT